MSKYFILFFGILICIGSNAQSGIHLGPKMFGGASFIIKQKSCDLMSIIPDDQLKSATLAYDFKFGYFAGGTVGYFFRRDMGIELDVLYFNGGQNYSDVYCQRFCAARYEVTKKITLSHVQIPIMFKWIIGQEAFIKGYVAGGPNLGFLIAGSENGRITQLTNDSNKVIFDTVLTNVDVLTKTNKFDLSFNLEGGIHIYFKKTFYLNVGLNTNISLFDINSDAVKNCVSRNDGDEYHESRNTRLGFVVSLNYVFKNNERRIRWRNGSF